ncbi:hypothetical protein MXD81_27430, partial [Microbacteriaceae bacterium K1510]|nr:hypothetical protein [Microbacteriaceae bacterium K1510]
FMDRATQLAEDAVYGEKCIPFQIKMTAGQWLANSHSPLFEPLRGQLAGRTDVNQILNDSTVKITLWIGKDDQLIRQY